MGSTCAAAHSNQTHRWPGGCLLAAALLQGRRQGRALEQAPWRAQAHEASLAALSWRPEAQAPGLRETPAASAVWGLRLLGIAAAPGAGAPSQVGA